MLNVEVAAVRESEPRMLLKPLVRSAGWALGATAGAMRMNNLRMIRTHLDNRGRRARGHEPV